jgi:trehalose 6-phosphate synthase
MSGLVVASNRGPLQFALRPDGGLGWSRGAGGLVSALAPVLKGRACTWISAAMTDGDRVVGAGAPAATQLSRSQPRLGRARLRLLTFERATYDRSYQEVANRTLWFLQHHLLDTRTLSFDERFRASWACYREVNRTFAAACAGAAADDGSVHLEDYHLALAPAMLRRRRPDVGILHLTCCPWAGPDYFGILPDDLAGELLAGMLGADLLGFLTDRWARNFLACCEAAGYDVDRECGVIRAEDGHKVHVRSYPLGVDQQALWRLAQRAPTPRGGEFGQGRLVVRVDRMEPTKNILRGLDGFAAFLERHPRCHGEVTHAVVTNLSRPEMAEYQRYRAEVEHRVEEINHCFGTPSWTPVRLIVLDDHPRALRAMAVADVLVVNPVWDGMNLVAKEAVLVNQRDAVLILSRNAGAADDLRSGAWLVNPFDTAELAEALAGALAMPAGERAERSRRLRTAATSMPPRRWFAVQNADLARVRRSLSPEP